MTEQQVETTATDNVKSAELTDSQRLKMLQEESKARRAQEKELRDRLNAKKDDRKKARHTCAKAKTEALDKRQEMADSMREINGLMLSKSIKNNLSEFEEILGKFREAASAFINAGTDYIEAVEKMKEFE